MRFVLCSLVLAVLVSGASAGDADKAVAEFEAIVKKATTEWIGPYVVPSPVKEDKGKFCRLRVRAANAKYDVKKTDSVIKPFSGVLDFTLAMEHSAAFATKEEAEKADFVKPTVNKFPYRAFFDFKGGRWEIAELVSGWRFGFPEFEIFYTKASDAQRKTFNLENLWKKLGGK